jgi:GMP synthase-like glutamine amidotransferase
VPNWRPTTRRRCHPGADQQGAGPGSIVVGVASKVLFIYNDPIAPEAILGEVFTERGFDIDTFNVVPVDQTADPAAIDIEFPDPLNYDVIVPLGSRWSVYDDALRAGWVGAQMATVREAVNAGVGVLGVCFGGQLVAQALGGTVRKAPSTELGWHEIITDRTDLIPDGPWFEWHSDQFSIPPGATELARNAHSSQAFVLGTAMGLQFHPELNEALLQMWIDDDKGDLERLGLDEEALRARTLAEQDGAAGRLRTLVSGFLDRVARPICQA